MVQSSNISHPAHEREPTEPSSHPSRDDANRRHDNVLPNEEEMPLGSVANYDNNNDNNNNALSAQHSEIDNNTRRPGGPPVHNFDVTPQTTNANLGIPQIVVLDKGTVVSGIDGTLPEDGTIVENSSPVGEDQSQLEQSAPETENDREVESTVSEDPLFLMQRRFLQGLTSQGPTNVNQLHATAVQPAPMNNEANDDPDDAGNEVSVLCGIDFSKRSNQRLVFAIGLLLVGFTAAVMIAVLFGTGVIGSQQSVATSQTGTNPPNFSGSSLAPNPTSTLSPTTQSPRESSPSSVPSIMDRPNLAPSSPIVGTSSPIATPRPSIAPITSVPSLQPTPDPTPIPTPNPVIPAPSPVPTTLLPSTHPTPEPPTAAPVTSAPVAPSISSQPSVHVEWVQVGNNIDGEAAFDQSGVSVALSSNALVVAVGALGNDGPGGTDSGRVRVFGYMGGAWIQVGDALDGTSAGDLFGSAVSLSADGRTLAVGARSADRVNVVNAGEVRMFRWNGSIWGALGSAIVGQDAEANFGFTLALSDDGAILAVGAPNYNGVASDTGRVRVFEWTGLDWIQRGNNLDGSSFRDKLGDAVALSSNGSIVACGGDGHSGAETSSGHVRIFRWSGTAWQQLGNNIIGFSSVDFFGTSVSLSRDGTVVAIGADRGNYCAVYGYDEGNDWFQIGQTINGVASNDIFGWSVAISLSGDTVVIGGPWNGSNGFFSGHAVVYRLSPDNEWVRLGQEIIGESGSRTGISVSISDDGTRVAVGGDGQNSSTGRVRIFELQ